MTLITTAPERLALILKDSHADVAFANYYFEESLDEIERPAWLVYDMGSEHFITDRSAETVDEFTETYRLELHGKRFGQGQQDQYEIQVRELVSAAIDYFRRHQQLQFSDDRGLVGTHYGPLRYVKHVAFRREPAAVYGNEEQGVAWGAKINLTITGMVNDYQIAWRNS